MHRKAGNCVKKETNDEDDAAHDDDNSRKRNEVSGHDKDNNSAIYIHINKTRHDSHDDMYIIETRVKSTGPNNTTKDNKNVN